MQPGLINIADSTMEGFEYDALPYVQQCTVYTTIEEALSAAVPQNALAMFVAGELPGLDSVDAHLVLQATALAVLNTDPRQHQFRQDEVEEAIQWKRSLSMVQRDALHTRNILHLGAMRNVVILEGMNTTDGIPLYEVRTIAAFVKRLRYMLNVWMGSPITGWLWPELMHTMRQTDYFVQRTCLSFERVGFNETPDLLTITTRNCTLQVQRATDAESLRKGIPFHVMMPQQLIHTLLNIFEPPRVATALPSNNKVINHE